MNTLAKAILAHTEALAEGTAVCAKALLHLGSRAAVDQALSRLVKRGHLLRLSQGVYVRPVESRFGARPPSVSQTLEAFAGLKGETVVPHGAAAANRLGLTQQVPVRLLYLTSGPSRRLTLGSQTIELRHAPRWQLALAGRPAGEALRTLAWFGPGKAGGRFAETEKQAVPVGTAGNGFRTTYPSGLARRTGQRDRRERLRHSFSFPYRTGGTRWRSRRRRAADRFTCWKMNIRRSHNQNQPLGILILDDYKMNIGRSWCIVEPGLPHVPTTSRTQTA